MPEEIPLGEDCKDWSTRLTDAEEGAWGLFDRRVARRVQRELLGPTAHT